MAMMHCVSVEIVTIWSDMTSLDILQCLSWHPWSNIDGNYPPPDLLNSTSLPTMPSSITPHSHDVLHKWRNCHFMVRYDRTRHFVTCLSWHPWSNIDSISHIHLPWCYADMLFHTKQSIVYSRYYNCIDHQLHTGTF